MPTEPSSTPVHVSAVRRIPAEGAATFEARLHAFLADALAQPGCLGMQVLRRPVGPAWEYTVLARFLDVDARRAFVARTDYRRWMDQLDALAEGPAQIHELSGLEPWFTVPGEARPPPAWKMAVVTWLAVSLVTTALLPFAPRVLGALSFPWGNILFNLPVVALLTWVVMPLATRALRRWLFRSEPEA